MTVLAFTNINDKKLINVGIYQLLTVFFQGYYPGSQRSAGTFSRSGPLILLTIKLEERPVYPIPVRSIGDDKIQHVH
jgi:hypothetical protein